MTCITLSDLAHRLEALAALDDAERATVHGLVQEPQRFVAGSVLMQQAESVVGPRILTAGWAWRTRTLPSGRQQVFAIVLPGDFIGLCWRPRPRALSSTVAITAVETVDASALLPVMRSRGQTMPGLWEALTLASRHDEMRLLDQVVRLGQQTAPERIASLMLELHNRLLHVRQADADSFAMPLTQEHLASTLGLSLVHVNRSLQQLRRMGLLEVRGGRAFMPALDELKAFCSFEATARPYAEAV